MGLCLYKECLEASAVKQCVCVCVVCAGHQSFHFIFPGDDMQTVDEYLLHSLNCENKFPDKSPYAVTFFKQENGRW